MGARGVCSKRHVFSYLEEPFREGSFAVGNRRIYLKRKNKSGEGEGAKIGLGGGVGDSPRIPARFSLFSALRVCCRLRFGLAPSRNGLNS